MSGPDDAKFILFVDLANETEEVRAASEVPESIAFVECEGKRVAVARIEFLRTSSVTRIHSYDARGTLLRSTTGTG